jgi:hypothetical protein
MDRHTLELASCQRHFPSGCIVCDGDPEDWWSYGFRLPHRGFVIVARFQMLHPFAPPNVYLSPEPVSRHYYMHGNEKQARLCYLHPSEWSPRLNLLVAVCAAIRFVNDYRAGVPDAQ